MSYELSPSESRIQTYMVLFLATAACLYVAFAASLYALSAMAGVFLAVLSLFLIAKTKHVRQPNSGWLVQLMDGALIAGLASGVIVGFISFMQAG